MNFLAAIFNIALFGFTCLVLLTDGISKEIVYILFSLLLLLVPVLNLVMIFLGTKNHSWLSFEIKSKSSEEQKRKTNNLFSEGTFNNTLVIISNILLLGFSCWAIIDQYPHPKEDGLIIYILVVFLTPILSSLVIFRNRAIFGSA